MADRQAASDNVDWRDTVTWYTDMTPVARVTKVGGIIFLYLLSKVDCTGGENVPATGPCIVAANHLHYFDIIYFGRFTPRYPHFMAKRELYENPLFGWYLRQLGSFPVNRGESDVWALNQANRVLEAGQILFMFPEGTRSGRKARLKKGKLGAVKLALEHQVPLIPAAIWGTENLRYTLTRSNNISIRFGQPLDLAGLAGPPPYDLKMLREFTTVLMQQIAALLPPEYRGAYG